MRKLLLSIIGIFSLGFVSNSYAQQVEVFAAQSLLLCPNNQYQDLDTIIIAEANSGGFAQNETGVTYSLIMPSGIKLEPFTGSVSFSSGSSFSNTSILVNPDSVEITYDLGAANATDDTIYITGLRVRTSTPSLALNDIIRGGTASHTDNEIVDANSHGAIASGLALTGVSIVGTNISCNGLTDGQIAVTITSGNAPYDYSLDFGTTYPFISSPITGLGSGGYFVTVRDSAGCVANSGNVAVIVEPSLITETFITKTDITCNGDGDGSITALASGGTGVITYSIDAGTTFPHANGSTVNALSANTYDVIFRDANSCVLDATDATIVEPSAISIGAPSSTDPSTGGGIDGQIVFGAVSGGAPPYDYSINAGTSYQSSGTFNNLPGGSYLLQVRDDNNCVQVLGPLSLTDPGNISVGGISFNGQFDTTVCNGETTALVIQSDSAQTGGGVSYLWQYSTNGVTWVDIASSNTQSYSIPGPHTSLRYYRRRTKKSGDIGFSNVVQRNINNGNTINITIPSPLVCIEGNNQIISASPAPGGSQTGVFTISGGSGLTDNGNGTSSFNPSTAGVATHTVFYTFTNEFTCQSMGSANVQVTQNAGVSITPIPTNYSTVSSPQNLNGTPSGGTFSGPGVVSSQFRPNIADTGVNVIIYTQFDINGCLGIDSVSVTVTAAGSGGSISGINTIYCTDDGIDVLTGSPEAGGIAVGFTAIPGFLTPTGPNTANINPSGGNVGSNTVEFQYTVLGTPVFVQRNVQIASKPNATIITNGSTTFCFDDPVRTLNGLPTPGGGSIIQNFVGAGITNGSSSPTADFTASTATVGTWPISYIYQDANGCNDTATVTLTVNPIPSPSITGLPVGNYCSNDPTDTLIGFPVPNGTTTFGSFSGSGLSNDILGTVNFTPGIPTLGNQVFTYTFINQFGCSNSVDESRSVALIPTATISGLDVDYCINSNNDVLVGASNPVVAGTGIFIGMAGANGSIDSSTGQLNVTGLIPNNTYQYGYVFTNSNGCIDTAFASTFVNALPVVNLVIDTSFCVDEGDYFFQGTPIEGSGDDGAYSGPGISASGTQGIFDPGAAGVGVHELKYIFTDGHTANNCIDSASQLVTVNALPSLDFQFYNEFTGDTISDLRFCKNEDSIVVKSNKIYGTHFYTGSSGLFIQSSLLPGEGYINPSASAGTGNRNITYRFVSDTTGCENSLVRSISINPKPSNFNFTGITNGQSFCSQDDSVLLAGSITTQNSRGFGTYRLSPVSGGNPGGLNGISPFDSDTAWFNPDLTPNSFYQIYYRFTDTVTGCQDSINKTVFINPEPVPNITITNSGSGTVNYNQSSPPYDICTNGNAIEFRGFDGVGQVSFNKVNFYDPIQPGNVKKIQSGLDSVYAFFPTNTNALGLRTIIFEMESNLSCTDSFSFQLNLLDTPSLNLLIDPTYLSSLGQVPEVCKNVDSILINTNSSMNGYGILSLPFGAVNLPFITSTDTVANPSNDTSLYVYPNQIVSTLPVAGRIFDINYQFTETMTGSGCTNLITSKLKVNPLPRNFDYFSIPANRFNPNVSVLNEFCTEEDTITLVGTFNNSGNPGSGFFKLSGDTASPTGGIFNIGIDTSVFVSSLPGGEFYRVWYIFTDSITGCSDSINRQVSIFSEPELSVDINNGSLLISNLNNPDSIPICTNGSIFELRGFNLGSPVALGEQVFNDLVDNISTFADLGGANFYVFDPKKTNILGLHDLQFDFTSNSGCKDKFTFQVFVVDTPSLDIYIDSTFLTTDTLLPRVCWSIDTLMFSPLSNRIGNGTFTISPGSINSDIYRDSVSGDDNDTLLHVYPSQILRNSLINSRQYTISYNLIERETGLGCSHTTYQDFIVDPIPNLNTFTIQSQYCEYDELDTIFGQLTFNNQFVSGYFNGPGLTNYSNDSASFDPASIPAAFTNSGSQDTVWYIVENLNQCVDSISRIVKVFPKPDIEFTIGDTANTISQFCKTDNSVFIIYEVQPNGVLTGTTTRKFDNLTLSGNNFIPFGLPQPGPQTLSVILETFAGCKDTATQIIYVYPDPIADFTVNNFCIEDPINFIDSSSVNDNTANLPATLSTWHWSFSNFVGDTSNLQNPTFNYDTTNLGQGTYNVELVVTNSVGCTDNITKNIFFGDSPNSSFRFTDFCEDRNITFVNNSTNTSAVLLNNFNWTLSPFNNPSQIIDTFISNTNFNYVFNDPGTYLMNLSLFTDYGCTDDTTIRLDIKPVINLASGSYNSNFNNDSLEWRPRASKESSNGIYSWQQATPNGNRITNGPGGTSDKAWVTNPSGQYATNEKSYVEGPCFNFAGTKKPMISLDYYSDVNQASGAVLQFSFDQGQTWRNVGQLETGVEWFNENSIAGNPGDQALGQIGWSEINSGWTKAKHNLDMLRNLNNIRLRVAFGAGGFGGNSEGFAFGNIQIRERDKKVIVEHFTNSSDPNAKQGDLDHNDVLDGNSPYTSFRSDAIDIQYHTDFPNDDPINLDNSLEQGARTLFYGVSSVPRTVFEGNRFNNTTSTWVANANILADGKQKNMAYRILENAKFNIALDVNKTNTNVSGTATVTAKTGIVPGREYTLFIAVIEKEINPNLLSGGIVLQGVEFRNVFKKFLPQTSGTNITTLNNPNDSRVVNFSWNYANVYSPDSIHIVAFIQDNITREIYQVESDDVSGVFVPTGFEPTAQNLNKFDFKMYPNPSKGQSVIEFSKAAKGEEVLSIYNQMGHLITEEQINMGTQSLLINLEDYPSGIYIIQIAHPELGVKRSKLVISK